VIGHDVPMPDSPGSPLDPTTTWRELPPPGEEQAIADAVERLLALQRKARGKAPPQRALHAKGVLGVRGVFEVPDDLPSFARHGVFAAPRRFAARVRFSNASALIRRDTAPDVRGIAIQLLDVAGPRALGDTDTGTTQDFLAIDRDGLPFRSITEFATMQRVGAFPLSGLFIAIGKLGLGRTFALVKALTKPVPPITSLSELRYFSNTPIRVGPYAAQFALVATTTVPAPSDKLTTTDLGAELKARLATQDIEYAFEARFFVDEMTTPIEDPSVVWSGSSVRLATLTIPRQDPTLAHDEVEAASFDPWHAIVEHQPLGTLMRARKAAYFASVQARAAK